MLPQCLINVSFNLVVFALTCNEQELPQLLILNPRSLEGLFQVCLLHTLLIGGDLHDFVHNFALLTKVLSDSICFVPLAFQHDKLLTVGLNQSAITLCLFKLKLEFLVFADKEHEGVLEVFTAIDKSLVVLV